MGQSKEINRFRANWQKEIDGAALYLTLAEIEAKPELSNVYHRLAESEQKHAAVWEKMLEEAGARVPRAAPPGGLKR